MTPDEIVAEAKAEREKEIELAQIHENAVTERHKRTLLDKAARRPWKVGAFALFLAALTLSVIAYFVYADGAGKRHLQERDNIRQQQTAQECIRQGNLWVNDNCLIANKQ